MEGVMMRGADRTAIAMRLPGDEIYLRTRKLKPAGKLRKIPILRGIISFADSLFTGMGTLMESADILEENFPALPILPCWSRLPCAASYLLSTSSSG